jgi:pyruvate formate lyase activating enzyme
VAKEPECCLQVSDMKEASFYSALEDGNVRCGLCPHRCLLGPGETGICLARTNREGKLVSDNYGKVTSLHADPIEKKPLYHFFPGSNILSAGSYGCNLKCSWCQNAGISQSGNGHFASLPLTYPEEILASLERFSVIGLAYTYNEPVVWFEYMRDVARLVMAAGRKNVVVSNGYINADPLEELMELTHAFNIDLKAFSDAFYRRQTGGRLSPVRDTLVSIRKKGLHLEITFLVVAGLNDDTATFREMLKWISGELGDLTVLHISRYFPAWQLHEPATPLDVMRGFYDMGREHLPFVYLGNAQQLKGTSDTYCPACRNLTIERKGYHTEIKALDDSGRCMHCLEQLPFVL